MPNSREKVVVAMSGGVDSSVAACLLVEQGYEVLGLFMRTGVKHPDPPARTTSRAPAEMGADTNARIPSLTKEPACGTPREHKGCCSASDAADARFVAGLLGIPFYALNFEREFDTLIDYFADEYARGRTPNPCVLCNNDLKFGRLLDYADSVGARYIATGHYARVEREADPNGSLARSRLLRAVDRRKDQSYVLFGIDRAVLDRLIFPIGELTKPEVREIARRYNLPNRDKPDSVEICFVPDRDYARVVRQRRPEVFTSGTVVDPSGQVLGHHDGVAHYTIGQRRGLGIAAGRPIYVTRLDAAANTVVVGEDRDLLCEKLTAERVSFLIDPPAAPFTAQVKIRYLHAPAPATVTPRADGTAYVQFDEPQRAVTPGQAVVFYDKDVLLGGGWIA